MRFSIGVKLALGYSAVTFVALLALVITLHEMMEARVEDDVELVLEAPVRQLREAFGGGADAQSIEELVRQQTNSADDDLRLGIQVFDADGNKLIEAGSFLDKMSPALHPEVKSGEERHTFYERDFGDSYPYRILASRMDGGPGGSEVEYVQAAIYTRRFLRPLDDAWDASLVILPVAIGVTILIGWLLARASLRPVRRMTRTARNISARNLDRRIPRSGSRDELDQLAKTLNAMIERIGTGLERIRLFSSNAAHELRTPIARLRSRVDVTLEQPRSEDEYRRVLDEIRSELDSMNQGVDGLLRLSQSEAGLSPEQRVEVPVRPLLDTVVEFFEPLALDHGVKLLLGEVPDAEVNGDPSWLHQLFANLLHNAIKYTPEGGEVRVEAQLGSGRVRVDVHDSGPGIPADETERIFERFHRLDERRSEPGFGLGLALAREIAGAHGGSIRCTSVLGEGCTFTVELPVVKTKSK